MKIKVAHIITRLDLGGAQQNTLHTLQTLNREKFEAILICGVGGLLDSQVRNNHTLSAFFLESLLRELSPLHDFLALLEMRRILIRCQPHIVHTHSSKAGILGRLAALLAGVPVIVHTYHGFGFHERQPKLLRWFYVLLEKFCARITSKLIFVSHANVDYARSYGIITNNQWMVIRSGIRLQSFPAPVDAAQLKMSAGIGRHKRLVISIGNLKPQKNAGDFVCAAAKIIASEPDTRFVFLGDGPLRTELQAQAFSQGLDDRLFFLGWRQDGPQWLAAADVFVLTSLWEGLPRALLEAMKSGLACVAYSTDGIIDVLQNGINGYLVASGDVAALASHVLEILRDEGLRRKLGEAAAASIGQEFDIDAMVRAQEALYERLIKRELYLRPIDAL